MSGNNNGVYIIPDVDDFLEVMGKLQEQYHKEEEDME